MKFRLNLLVILLYLSFFAIIGRLYYLQIIRYDFYQEKLSNLTDKQIVGDSAPRGRIYDQNGILLVDNTLVKTIYYKNNENLSEKEEVELAYCIKDYLDIDYSKLTISYLKDFYLMMNEKEINERLTNSEKRDFKERKLSDNEYYRLKKSKVSNLDIESYQEEDKKAIYIYYLMNDGYSYDDKIIKTNASEEEFAFFSESSDNLHGFNTKYTYERMYLHKDTLKTVLGSVGKITSENKNYYLNKGYRLNDIVGLSNLEYVYDDNLKGSKEEYIVKNGDKILIKEGVRGNDLYLTIDINLQKMVDEILINEIKLAKKSFNTKYFDRSYITITNPNDGSILAFSGKIYQEGEIYDYTIGTFLDSMTPGSVVKGVSMLVGYQEGVVKVGEYMMDECIKLKATPKKCSIYNMGYINDIDALAKSSNVYQFKIALKVGGVTYRYDNPAYIKKDSFNIYRNYFNLFGLGTKTGIELPNESQGVKGKGADAGLLMNLAIGQYDTYTNLELNQYIATLATGKRHELHLLKKVQKEKDVILEFSPKVLNDLNSISSKYLERVRLGLFEVIRRGTGYGYIDSKLSPHGKTGTSETFVDSNLDGIYETESISTSFVAYFPSNEAKYAISISTPNISYVNNSSSYIYPFNKNVIRKITDNLKFLN